MTDENWNNFKKVFASEKADFVSYLENNFSDLTESTVKKAKQRLQKKYDNYELIFKGIQN
ncbi:hypothetical protein OBK20_06735 [Empedobacter falsenii]